MASVWAQIAQARALTGLQNTAARGLAEALAARRQEEERRKQLEMQFGFQRDLANEQFLRGLVNAAYQNVLRQVSEGKMTPEQAKQTLGSLLGSINLPGGADVISAITGVAGAARAARNEDKTIEFSRWLAQHGVAPDKADEAAKRWFAGDREGAALLVGKSAAQLEGEAKQAGIDLTRAQTVATEAGTELTKARTKGQFIQNAQRAFELEKGRKMLPYEMKILESKAKWIDEQLRADVEKTIAQTENIKAGTEQAKARTDQILQQIAFDAAANPIKLELLEKDKEYRDAQIKLVAAQTAGQWERAKEIAVDTARKELQYFKEKSLAGLDLSFVAIKRISDIAEMSPEAAQQFIKNNMDLLQSLGVTEEEAMRIANTHARLQAYTGPKMRLALNTLEKTAANPPPANEREQKKQDIYKQLIDSGMDEIEARNLVDMMENAWNNADALLDLQREKLRLQSGNGSADWLKDRMQARNYLSLMLQRASTSINQIRQSSPCQFDGEKGYVLNPEFTFTTADGRTITCKQFAEVITQMASEINSLALENARGFAEEMGLGVFDPATVMEVMGNAGDLGQAPAPDGGMTPGTDFPVTPDSFNTPADQMNRNALNGIEAWARGRISRGFEVSEREFRSRLKSAAPGLSNQEIQVAIEVAKEQGLITK